MTWGQWACGLAAKDRTSYLMDENTSYFISVFPGWVHTNCPLRCSTITQSNTMLTPPNYIVPDHRLTWTRIIEGHGRTPVIWGTIDSASQKRRSCGSAHLLIGKWSPKGQKYEINIPPAWSDPDCAPPVRLRLFTAFPSWQPVLYEIKMNDLTYL